MACRRPFEIHIVTEQNKWNVRKKIGARFGKKHENEILCHAETLAQADLIPMAAKSNILLIRFKSMGDILFTLPAVHAVRENFPSARLHFLVSREYAPLVCGFAGVDEIIPVDRAAFRSKNPLAVAGTGLGLLRALRHPGFSLAVDFQGYGETALLAWLSGARERWGSVYGKGRRWAYTRGIAREDSLHVADWNLSLLRQCGLKIHNVRNEFVMPAGPLAAARRFFAAQNLDAAKPTLFIQPFTSAPSKNWPLENFLALARYWRSRGVQILFGGGPADNAALEPARVAAFPVSAGAPLMVSAGLAKLATLVIGGDTGLLHLAVAMDKRVVMIMSSNAPGNSYPYQHPDWTVSPAAGKKLTELDTGAVIAACARGFAEAEKAQRTSR
jgi:ADP-heptose:LPS heptosyltransferase